MITKRVCRLCNNQLDTVARADALYCSSKCRTYVHRNPFPKELTRLNRWIRYSKTKVPLTPDNHIASSTAPRTWSSYKWVKDSDAGVGIGFVFNGDGIIGIDLDNAFDCDRKLKPWAKQILDELPATYTEVSRSRNGLHIIGFGEVLSGRRWKVYDGGIEIYGSGRYFTMTGNGFGKSPLKLAKLTNALDVVSNVAQSLENQIDYRQTAQA